MTYRASIPSKWALVGLEPEGKARVVANHHVLWPRPKPLNLPSLLSGLAPNRDHNAELLRAVTHLDVGRSGTQPMFSVFAADPFINGKRIARTLLAKRFRRVMNWPTTGMFGAEYAATLDSLNLGPAQESQALQQLAAQGMSISAAVSLPESVDQFLALGPEVMFVAPGFECWKKDRLDKAAVLRRCATISSIVSGRVPLILMSNGGISLDEARNFGATGILTA